MKEDIANAALSYLTKDKGYENLANTKVEFGCLYNFEGHGIEALLKIITDKTTSYFAVQGARLIKLNFSDDLFEMTVESFLDQNGLN